VAAVAGVVMVAADIPLGVWRMEGAVEVIRAVMMKLMGFFVFWKWRTRFPRGFLLKYYGGRLLQEDKITLIIIMMMMLITIRYKTIPVDIYIYKEEEEKAR
jgi:divalent metal cation (Fe/Co/Zn/Cd) transporter